MRIFVRDGGPSRRDELRQITKNVASELLCLNEARNLRERAEPFPRGVVLNDVEIWDQRYLNGNTPQL